MFSVSEPKKIPRMDEFPKGEIRKKKRQGFRNKFI
jgi:hypothetical protein